MYALICFAGIAAMAPASDPGSAPLVTFGTPRMVGRWISFSPDSTQLLTYRNALIIWDVKTGKQIKTIETKSAHLSAWPKVGVPRWIPAAGGNRFHFTSAHFSPDGSLVAVTESATREHVVFRFDDFDWNSTGKPLATFRAEILPNYARAWFSRDSKSYLIAVSGVNVPKPWITSCDSSTGLRQWRINLLPPIPAPLFVNEIATHDNRRVTVLYENGGKRYAEIWDGAKGEKCLDLPALPDSSFTDRANEYSLTSTPDGRSVVVTYRAEDRFYTGYVADLDTGRIVRRLEPQARVPESAESVVSPDGKTLAVAGQELCFWNLETGQALHAKGHASTVQHVMVTPDSRYVISTASDLTTRCWSIIDGREKWCRIVKSNATPETFTSDGSSLVMSDCTLLDLSDGKSKPLPGHLGDGSQGLFRSFSTKGRLATTYFTEWQKQRGAFGDEERIVGEIRIFTWPEGRFQKRIQVSPPGAGIINPYVFQAIVSVDAKKVHAVVHYQKERDRSRDDGLRMRPEESLTFIETYEIATGNRIGSIHDGDSIPTLISVDDRWLAANLSRKTPKQVPRPKPGEARATDFIDVESGKPVVSLQVPKTIPRELGNGPLSFSASGRYFAVPDSPHSYRDPHNIHVFDSKNGAFLKTVSIDHRNRSIKALSISHDGNRIVSADWTDGVVYVWDAPK